MTRGRPRIPLSEDRLIRKRLAAKLRQRRCRERKKGSTQEETKIDTVSKAIKADSATQPITKKEASLPVSQSRRIPVDPAPAPAYFRLPPNNHYPVYTSHQMSFPPTHHHHHPYHPRSHSHQGYAAQTYHYHRPYGTMPHHYHGTAPMPYTASAQSDTGANVLSIPRTVSRSFSDMSSDANIKNSDVLPKKVNKKKRKKSLASEEKTAVAAILSLKSNSSDDESSDDTISTTDETPTLASEYPDNDCTVIPRVDNAQSVFRVVSI